MQKWKDKLHRPVADKEVGELPLASDMLVASGSRRLCAFLIDAGIIGLIIYYGVIPFLESRFIYQGELLSNYAFRALTMILFLLWSLYVILFNASRLRATVGQLVMRIYVCSIFGERITSAVAFVRFLIFAAPSLLFFSAYMEEFASVLPLGIWQPSIIEVSHLFYPMLMAAFFAQIILIWPLLTGNVTRVWWDRIVHSCVLQRDPRIS